MNETSALKTCKKCGETKPESDFYFQKKYSTYLARCKECVKYAASEWRRKNTDVLPAKTRGWELNRSFGITVEHYEALLQVQGGVCAICAGPPNGRWKQFAVDHDHATGVIRGLLCSDCNRGIGYLGDSAENVVRSIAYLKQVDSR